MHTVDGAAGVFLTVKGTPLGSGRVLNHYHAGTEVQGAQFAALGISVPQLDLAAEMKPL